MSIIEWGGGGLGKGAVCVNQEHISVIPQVPAGLTYRETSTSPLLFQFGSLPLCFLLAAPSSGCFHIQYRLLVVMAAPPPLQLCPLPARPAELIL